MITSLLTIICIIAFLLWIGSQHQNYYKSKDLNPHTIWSCEHHHHSASRCPECFDPNKKYITVKLSDLVEKLNQKKLNKDN
jgi:hypothetical protein